MENRSVQRPVKAIPVKWVRKDKFKKVESKKFKEWLSERPLGE